MTELAETEFLIESLKEKKYFTADFFFAQGQQKAITKRIVLKINGTQNLHEQTVLHLKIPYRDAIGNDMQRFVALPE